MGIGEKGTGLSGGQRQTVAIARALIRETPIVLMDEPTNAMDQMTESRIVAMFKEEFADRTVILSTQKMSILDAVDRVIVMHDGKVFMDGPKAEVLKALKEGRGGKA
jgi:ATP-binding cassette subfamily C protein LapB